MTTVPSHLTLHRVGVTFPVLQPVDRSLRASLLRKVGGDLSGSDQRPVVKALHDVSIALAQGSRLALMGHNGAGKSTLLKVCAGIFEPTEGTLSSSGSVASMTDFMMGMDPDLSGYRNIERRAAFMGLSRAEARDLVPEVEAFSDLGDFLSLPIRTYSTGMVVRLAFAISTSIQPDILLMDEMITAGDMAFAGKSAARMEQLLANARILVLASHDLGLLERTCDRAIVLRKGAVIHEGSVSECAAVYRRSASAETA